MPVERLRLTVHASLMAAMIAVGAYIHIPLGPVPIVLQNLFVLLAGLTLGSSWGLAAVSIYLLAGAMGIPVFAGARGGIVHFFGPTGGYLLGFAAAAFAAGFIAERFKGRRIGDVVAVLVGSMLVYAFGVPWLKVVTGMEWTKSFMIGMIPFLPGDIAKAAGAVILARSVRPILIHQMRHAAS